MHRVYFSTSKVGESGGPKHAPHEIFSEIDLAKFSPPNYKFQSCES